MPKLLYPAADWKGQVVYSADLDAVVIHQLAGQLRTDPVGSMADEALLLALPPPPASPPSPPPASLSSSPT